jgi:ribosomal-protein-alanine N-acetyltransferase
MLPTDIPYVAHIEQEVFDVPWTAAEFRRALASESSFGLVAEWHDIIIGYAMVERVSGKQSTHLITNLAVISSRQRSGIGRQLVEMVTNIVRNRAALQTGKDYRLMAEVRETNLRAQQFFRRMGFVATQVLSDWYDDVTEDAYLFCHVAKHIATVPQRQLRFPVSQDK